MGEPRSPRPRRDLLIPQPTSLDLHDMTVHEAFAEVRDFLNTHDAKVLVVITGKSGDIRREFPQWLDRIKAVRSYEEMNGGGAFQIKLK